jgi:hypothetical protein
MDSIDLDILKYMSNRDRYYELKDLITKSLCVKESWTLLADFGAFFNDHPTENDITKDFILWQRIQRHPNWKPEEAKVQASIVQSILAAKTPDRAMFLDSIHHLRSTSAYRSIADDMASGTITASDAEIRARTLAISAPVSDTLVKLDLTTINNQSSSSGYYWRLEDLNKSLGTLNKGDFIIVAKRPEVGGTSFLVSEMAFMLEQMDGNAIIFNNEEAPAKVYSRMVSAALGIDYRKLLGDPAKYQAQYDTWRGKSEWDLVHDGQMTISSIHKQLEEKPYDLIGINVLLKVGGTHAEADHDKFQALGEECRRISQAYGPVIAIVQADPSAEGLQYIPQDRIYKSKTALQGEADGLIMIGTDDPIIDDVRYIHVAKNKLPPAACTHTKFKHIKSQVDFSMDTGRFTSIKSNFPNHSRP